MIVVFQPLGIRSQDFQRYCHCWKKFGEKRGEAVVVRQPQNGDVLRSWDQINRTPGARVVWTLPHFIPLPSFFDELDYFRDEGQLIVLLCRYDALIEHGHDRPYEWRPNGISRAMICFQLAGQTKYTLPPASPDLWKWLKKDRGWSYQVPQRYAGARGTGPVMRSNLGIVMGDCWNSCSGAFGRVVTGEGWDTQRQELRRYWLDLIDGWELWLR